MSEMEKKEITMVQGHPYRFQSNTYAPVQTTDPITKQKKSGKGRFSVEIMTYVSGVGWDVLDISNVDGELLLGLYKYVKMHEDILGYDHVGNSSEQIKNLLENVWQKTLK